MSKSLSTASKNTHFISYNQDALILNAQRLALEQLKKQ